MYASRSVPYHPSTDPHIIPDHPTDETKPTGSLAGTESQSVDQSWHIFAVAHSSSPRPPGIRTFWPPKKSSLVLRARHLVPPFRLPSCSVWYSRCPAHTRFASSEHLGDSASSVCFALAQHHHSYQTPPHLKQAQMQVKRLSSPMGSSPNRGRLVQPAQTLRIRIHTTQQNHTVHSAG